MVNNKKDVNICTTSLLPNYATLIHRAFDLQGI